MTANPFEFQGHGNMKRAAIGFRMHSGWGATVVMSNEGALDVVDRRHIVVAQPTIPGSKQPYHSAEKLQLEDAEKYLASCATASAQLALDAICELLRDLDRRKYRVQGSAVLMASGRKLPPLAEILASHALIHTAEGEFFRSIVLKACEDLGMVATRLREREIDERAMELLGKRATQVKQRISSLGKRLGPPWTQDEKLAALAATLMLGA